MIPSDYLLRASDFSDFVEWLTLGDPLSEARLIVGLRRNVEEFAAMPNAKDTRFWMDGLGWFMPVELASTSTGRLFIATGAMTFESDRRTSAVHVVSAQDAALIDDLLATFGVAAVDMIDAES